MGYFNTSIGRLDAEVLKHNVDTIISRVNAGVTTLAKEVEYRKHEIEVLSNMTPKSSVTRQNNKRRIAYIKAEIYVLERIVL
jgi:hypothetical protein